MEGGHPLDAPSKCAERRVSMVKVVLSLFFIVFGISFIIIYNIFRRKEK